MNQYISCDGDWTTTGDGALHCDGILIQVPETGLPTGIPHLSISDAGAILTAFALVLAIAWAWKMAARAF